jgi:photosystem II stability/assembly factor-like uncharacterized protein
MYFADASTGWVVGKDGFVRKTTNGGTTWTAQTSGTSEDLAAVHFTDANNGIAVGGNGTVISTTNGGTTWATFSSGHTPTSGSDNDNDNDNDDDNDNDNDDDDDFKDLNDVQMMDANTAYACGKDGVFIKTTDHGATWVLQTSGTTSELNSLHFPSSAKGYICYKTGGVRHTPGTGVFTSVTAPTSKDLNGVYFVSDNKGWVVGDEGRVLFTANSGATWVTQNLSTVTRDLMAVHFPTATAGYAVGKDGVIIKSGGGETGTTAVADIAAAHNCNVYPNPATAVLTISGTIFADATDVSVNILNSTGSVVRTAVVTVRNGNVAISVDGLPAGLYLARVVSGTECATVKFQKN